jgi:hypothetical protein
MDQEIRNKLRNVVTQCRKLLEDSVSQELEGKYGIFAKKDQVTADPNAKMTHLSEEEQAARKDILDHYAHIKARGFKSKDALDQLIREIAFTHLNRLCAYKMMEAREVYVGGQKFREAVSRGVNSNGVKFYLAEHPEEERLFNTGHQDVAYRHFLDWLGGALSDEIGVLFNPNDPANRLYPRQKTLDDVLDLLNDGGIKAEETDLREQWPLIWSQDETIGWVYQYFTSKELRDQARKESQAPRNSYELAFRNQFFTPRYVVEFLTDNTLGRIWYEMRQGETTLKDQCRYMVRRPTEIFLKDGEQSPKDTTDGKDDLSQEELLKLPVRIPYRPKKDPRELKILDPACGSGHFLLYCFDLLLTIYEEAYADPDLGPALKKDYPTLDALMRDVPRLILAHNLHGIDIDLRASQIAALALWLRCQRAYQDMGLKKDRPKITRSNFVCAEPMPGEQQMLNEFVGELEPRLLGQVVEVIFDKMKLAGEAGSLLKIDEEIRDAVAKARKQWLAGPVAIQRTLFDSDTPVVRKQEFDLSGITDTQFFEQAEEKVLESLRIYAENAQNGHGLQRRLFTDDAVRGFAFVDVCHKRFDVVLMNPPFGKRSEASTDYYDTHFSSFKSDMGLAFVDHFSKRLVSSGLLGALTSRTFLAGGSFDDWRREILLTDRPVTLLLDLGIGVLDDALVETCAYTVTNASASRAVFLRALETKDKAGVICDFFQSGQKGALPLFSVSLKSMKQFPMSIMAYWLPPSVAKSISLLGTLETIGAATKHGVQTTDDFQFMRLAWEVPLGTISQNKRWPALAKGGEYSPYFDNLHLCVDWLDNGGRLKEYLAAKRLATQGSADWTPWMNSYEDYFKPGLTFPARTASDFSPRILPAGCVFTASGQAILFPSLDQAYGYLSGAFTRPFKMVVDAFVCSGDNSVSGSAANTYRTSLVNALPLPTDVNDSESQELGRQAVQLAIQLGIQDETSMLFTGSHFSVIRKGSLSSYAAEIVRCELERSEDLLGIAKRSEAVAQKHFGFPLELLNEFVGPLPTDYPKSEIDEDAPLTIDEDKLVHLAVTKYGPRRQLTKKSYFANRRLELLCHIFQAHPRSILEAFGKADSWAQVYPNVASDECSLYLGCAFGRWNVRKLLEPAEDSIHENCFSASPEFSPAMMNQESGGPEGKYLLALATNGVIPDDPENQTEDVVWRTRDVLVAIWKDQAESIEKEACNILGVKELRDYFRRPGKGGFWSDHISRYSKSRRNAPIYWLLQSSKKNYALWLYYHRLDKDMLFKALVNYVEPKIRLETSRLETLRSQSAAAGDSRKDAKRLAKDLEKQEDFLSELRDFEDKLRRAANLHLEPDLNDGVVLNIAPLHELVPWKEPKKYWDELMQGQYEWSSIGKQLRQKGLVK